MPKRDLCFRERIHMPTLSNQRSGNVLRRYLNPFHFYVDLSPMSQERRKYLRLNVSDETCQVKLGHETFEGQLLDESIGGARVGSVPLLALSLNQPVEIQFGSEVITGACRSVTRQADNLFAIGVRRNEAKPLEEEKNSGMLLNTFLELSGCALICIPIASVDENTMRVMMIDGREFEIDRSKLFSLTRLERVEKLSAERRFRNILRVYNLPVTDNAFDARDAIINQEFGPVGQFSMA